MKRLVCIICLICSLLCLMACQEEDNIIIVTRTEERIAVGTPYETTIYTFTSNQSGPTLFIVGGIHGDERAGWHTALSLLDDSFEKGIIHILPKANILACNDLTRTSEGINLNRIFPGNPEGSDIEKLAYEITQKIIEANPLYIFDLHESQRSRLEGGLGETVIFSSSNQSLFLTTILETFNIKEERQGKINFAMEYPGVKGSINDVLSNQFNIPVFTIETNRGMVGASSIDNETIPLDTRVGEQRLLLQEFFNRIFNESP